MSDESKESEPAPRSGPSSRRRTVTFVSVFVCSVLLLLAAYRFIINTPANDWYLFQVARHTNWVLGKIGYSSELEGREGLRSDPAQIRATLAAWRRGEETASQDEITRTSIAPLTAWEIWAYRVLKARRSGYNGSVGPHVSFTLRPGLTQRIAETEKAIEAAEKDILLDDANREAQLRVLREKLAQLQEAQRADGTPAEKRTRNLGYFFSFIVVSECGAIEVMAIFFAAVIAFPTRWWKRLVGILIGIPIMYLVNIFRLSCLGVIGALTGGGKWFDFSHHFAWQAIYIIFVVAVWLAWIEYLVNRGAWVESLFKELLSSRARPIRLAIFCATFLVSVTVLVILWWTVLPIYGYLLLQAAGGILRYGFRAPIEAGYIHAAGLFNTDSMLVLRAAGRERSMPLALLITNIPPYVALVLATSGLRRWRRVRILAYGCGILAAGHVLYIVILFQFQDILQRASEVPTAIIQFFLTLPFLLWIVFAYWDRMMANRDGNSASGTPGENRDTPSEPRPSEF